MGGSKSKTSNGIIYSPYPTNSTNITPSNDVEIIKRCKRCSLSIPSGQYQCTACIATNSVASTMYTSTASRQAVSENANPEDVVTVTITTRQRDIRKRPHQQVGAGYRLAGEAVPENAQQSVTGKAVPKQLDAGKPFTGKPGVQQSVACKPVIKHVVAEQDQIENCTAININQSSKHDLFLQRVISSFNLKQPQLLGRGFYCKLCDVFEIYQRRSQIVFHGDSKRHKENLQNAKNASSIELHTCKSCNAEFFGDAAFWIGHNSSNHHKILETIKPDGSRRNRYTTSGDHRSRSFTPIRGSMDGNGLKQGQLEKTNRTVKYSLLVSDLPANVTRGDIVKYFKGFGYIENVQVNGLCSAKITFKLRIAAKNIVDNGIPISINGKAVKLSLIEECID